MEELPKPFLWTEAKAIEHARIQRESLLKVCKSKKAHRLKVHAEAHALQLMNNPRKKFRASCPIYTYNCPVCGHWHLTKKKPK